MSSSKDAPPIEFASLGLDPSSFHRSDSRSWRGACPSCGGNSTSRRFVVFTDHPYPLWHGWCDRCGRKDKYWLKQNKTISQADLDRWERERQQQEQKRDIYRREKLAEFSTAELWKELHERMSDENYDWWLKQGVPRDWADFWQLGYTASKRFEHDGTFFERPAYSIPKFDLGWKPLNVDYRLIDPPDGVGKYRPITGLQPACFLSRPDKTAIADTITIVEGSKKAMVVAIYGDTEQVIGIPSKNSWAGVDSKVKDCGRVWIVLDPDATLWAYRLAVAIGPAARIVELPTKPDDAFISGALDSDGWQNYLRQAIRIS